MFKNALICLFMLVAISGCGSSGGSSPSVDGVTIQGAVNDAPAPFAFMEWSTSDGLFFSRGTADADATWSVFIPYEELRPDGFLIIKARNAVNSVIVRSVLDNDELLAATGQFSGDLTIVSHYTEAAFQLGGFEEGIDQARFDKVRDLINAQDGNPMPTGEPLTDHVASAIQLRFDNPNSSPNPPAPPTIDPRWQIWASDNQPELADRVPDCSSCHQWDFCAKCHESGDVYSNARFAEAVTTVHWSDFHITHPVTAQGDLQQCATCHEVASCAQCHDQVAAEELTDLSHRRSWSELPVSTTTHGRFNDSQCRACHPDSVLISHNWGSSHAMEARGNLATCQSCHAEGRLCLKCHSARSGLSINPHPANWDDLSENIDPEACIDCH